MSSDAPVEEMILAACLRAGSETEFTADLGAFLTSQGVDAEDVAAILAAPPRLSLYRRLVRNNLTGVTEKMLGRTRARIEALRKGAFDESFSSFLEEVGPRTHYLRDVPSEFLAWAEPRWRARTDLPAWAVDMARHELVEFQMAAAIGRKPPPVGEVSLDRGLVFAEPVRLLRYDFAVHELPADPADRTEPAQRATALLAYRDEEDAVGFLELTPLAAAITERLLTGATMKDALRDALLALNASAGLADVAKLLADLGERGILLGAPL